MVTAGFEDWMKSNILMKGGPRSSPGPDQLNWFDSKFDTSLIDGLVAESYLPSPTRSNDYYEYDELGDCARNYTPTTEREQELSPTLHQHSESQASVNSPRNFQSLPLQGHFQSMPPYFSASAVDYFADITTSCGSNSVFASSSHPPTSPAASAQWSWNRQRNPTLDYIDNFKTPVDATTRAHGERLCQSNTRYAVRDRMDDEVRSSSPLTDTFPNFKYTAQNEPTEFPNESRVKRQHYRGISQKRFDESCRESESIKGGPKQDALRTPNTILLVTVTNLAHPVTIELLTHLFLRYGAVQKIVTFSKTPDAFQALIQMESLEDAIGAYAGLNNKNIFENYNHLRIQYSRLNKLCVQQNNARAWDFTRAESMALLSQGYSDVLTMPKMPREIKEWKTNAPNIDGNVIIAYNLSKDVTIVDLFNIFSLYGVVTKVKLLREKPDSALVQYSDPVYSSFAKFFLSTVAVWDAPLQLAFSKVSEIKLPAGIANTDDRNRLFSYTDQRFSSPAKFARCVCMPTKTIFVASIENDTAQKKLLQLVLMTPGVAGYETRAPFVHGPKKTHMLIEYQHTQQALRSIAILHNRVLEGSQIKVAFSKISLDRNRAIFLAKAGS